MVKVLENKIKEQAVCLFKKNDILVGFTCISFLCFFATKKLHVRCNIYAFIAYLSVSDEMLQLVNCGEKVS